MNELVRRSEAERYARAYADHLAVGDPRPVEPPSVSAEDCAEIRRRLDQRWREKVQRMKRGRK